MTCTQCAGPKHESVLLFPAIKETVMTMPVMPIPRTKNRSCLSGYRADGNMLLPTAGAKPLPIQRFIEQGRNQAHPSEVRTFPMKSTSFLLALLATLLTILFAFPVTARAQVQNGGWVTPKEKTAFEQNRFPELKGLTSSQEDQTKAFDLCARYGGGEENRLCRLAIKYYTEEGQKEADTQKQQEPSSTHDNAQAGQSFQSGLSSANVSQNPASVSSQQSGSPSNVSTAVAPTVEEVQAIDNNKANADYVRGQQEQAEAQAKALAEAKAQAEAKATEQQEKAASDARSDFFWWVIFLGFIVANIILIVGAAKKKFVVFYDMKDIVSTSLIFVPIACGYILAWMVGDNFLHPVCIGLGFLLAAILSVVRILSSINHNKSTGLGIFVGLMKIYTVALLAFVALLSLIMMTASPETINSSNTPGVMSWEEKVARARITKRNGAILASIAAGLLYLLVNGKTIYAKRGWELPS
jgi:hypothetical protein